MQKTVIIREFRQADGWHLAGTATSPAEARDWCHRVDENGGHHHARRWRRVRRGSNLALAALDAELETAVEQ